MSRLHIHWSRAKPEPHLLSSAKYTVPGTGTVPCMKQACVCAQSVALQHKQRLLGHFHMAPQKLSSVHSAFVTFVWLCAVSGPAAQAAPSPDRAVHCGAPEAARADGQEAAHLRVSGELLHQQAALASRHVGAVTYSNRLPWAAS